jgi:hypothetical protein
MSAFALLHTGISLLPLGSGLVAFARDGKIDPKNRVGQWYLGTMLAASVSSWGFLLTKGYTPAQMLTLVTLALLTAAMFTLRGQWRKPGYAQTVLLSTSFLLLMVFTTTETLTRVPRGQPFATGPNDPALLPVRLALLAVFAIGVAYQVFKIRAAKFESNSMTRTLVMA